MRKRNRTLRLILVTLLVIALVVGGVLLLKTDRFGFNRFTRSKAIATVNGETITRQELAVLFNDYYANIDTYNMYALYYGMGQYYDVSTQEGVLKLKNDLLDTLVEMKVYTAIAKEQGFTLSDSEKDIAKQAGEDAYKNLMDQCIESAKEAGAADPKAQAISTVGNYFSGMGMSKSQWKASKVKDAEANSLMEKVNAYFAEQNVIKPVDMPAIYEAYVQEHYVDAYEEGAYSMQEYYRRLGQSNIPYLYVPEGFVFVRLVQLDEEAKAQEWMERIAEDPMAFEEAVQSEDNKDSFMKTLSATDGYGIGEKDSLFEEELYTAAKALAADGVELVELKNETTDENGNTVESSVWFIIKRLEDRPTGIVPYEQVKSELEQSLMTMKQNEYATEQLDAWKAAHEITKDEAAVAAIKVIS